MDERFIHLGKVSIPTVVLGLIPIRQQANPIARDRARRLEPMNEESRVQGRRRQDDSDVKARIAAIRERKERERAERRAAGTAAGGGSTRPPD